MDESIEYIEMCEKAQEIQSLYKNMDGDDLECGTFVVEENVVFCIGNYTVDDRMVLGELTNFIVLPTQCQLQEMLKSLEWFYNENNPSDMMDSLYYVYMCCSSDNGFNYTEYVKQFESFEQLWLSFVMNEKYNKTWDKNKKEWILKKY
jgi:hypothetical protein